MLASEKRAMDALMAGMDSEDDSSGDEVQEKHQRSFNSPDYGAKASADSKGIDCKDSNFPSDAPKSDADSGDLGIRNQTPPHVRSHRSMVDKHREFNRLNDSDAKSAPGKSSDSAIDTKLDGSESYLRPQESLTPTRAPPKKPSRASKPNYGNEGEAASGDNSPRVVELPDEGQTHAASIAGIRSPEFRGRYTTAGFGEVDSDDELDASKRFVLRRSSENLPSLQQHVHTRDSNTLSSRTTGSFVGRPSGPSSSDKVRMSEIDSFGNSSSIDINSNGNLLSSVSSSADGSFQPSMAQSTGEPSNRPTLQSVEAYKKWLTTPCSLDAPKLLCHVVREREGFSALHPTLRMYHEQSSFSKDARFMMAAKKIFGKGTSYYLISLDENPEDRGSESVLGRVKANAVGSEYIFTDGGVSGSKARLTSTMRKELGFVRYEFNSKGPSKIEAWLPHVSEGGRVSVWKPEGENDGMEANIKANNFENLMIFENKKPKWDAAHGGHVLNFHGRVTQSSVKNFQLCCSSRESERQEDVVLQFGKVDKNQFTLDLEWPLSPLQAFCICIASLDGKIADRKGYEFFKNTTNYLFGSKEK